MARPRGAAAPAAPGATSTMPRGRRAPDIPDYVLDYESRFRTAVIRRSCRQLRRARPRPVDPLQSAGQIPRSAECGAGSRRLGTGRGHDARRLARRGMGPNSTGRVRRRATKLFLICDESARSSDFLRFFHWASSPRMRRGPWRGVWARRSPTNPTVRISAFSPRLARLVERLRPEVREPGDIVDRSGRVLGRHNGIAHFTVGQRKGLGIAAGRAALCAGDRA